MVWIQICTKGKQRLAYTYHGKVTHILSVGWKRFEANTAAGHSTTAENYGESQTWVFSLNSAESRWMQSTVKVSSYCQSRPQPSRGPQQNLTAGGHEGPRLPLSCYAPGRPCIPQIGLKNFYHFTADILTCDSGKSTGFRNDVIDDHALFKSSFFLLYMRLKYSCSHTCNAAHESVCRQNLRVFEAGAPPCSVSNGAL